MTNPVSPVSAEELLPCPFCGKTPSISHFEFGGIPVSSIRCCFSDTGRRYHDDVEVIAAWNRRSPAASGAKVPGFLVNKAERAIHDATHKKGMQTNGPCMAMIEVSHLKALLRYAISAAPLPPDPNV